MPRYSTPIMKNRAVVVTVGIAVLLTHLGLALEVVTAATGSSDGLTGTGTTFVVMAVACYLLLGGITAVHRIL